MKIEKGELRIDLSWLIEHMTPDQKRDVVRYLAAQDTLIRAVVEKLADGHYFTDDQDGCWWDDGNFLTELRTKLVPLMDEVAREAVRGLITQTRQAKEEARRHRDWAWKLYHAWPRDYWRSRPELPDFVYTPPASDADVGVALVEEKER